MTTSSMVILLPIPVLCPVQVGQTGMKLKAYELPVEACDFERG